MATQPACFSIHWDVSAPECGKCFIRKECERALKRRETGDIPLPPEEPVEPEVEDIAPVDPLQHFLLGLAGKFNPRDKIGDNAIGHFFDGEDGKTRVLVTESKVTGRLKIQAKVNGQSFERVLDGIESVEAAEELLKAVLG